MRMILRLCKVILSIVSFTGSLVRFIVYIAFAIDIGVLFICGFGYFIAFFIPIAIIWAIPVVAGGLITKCDESIKASKENAYYEKIYRKNNDYQGTRHESHHSDYYENMGYYYRDPDTYEITSKKAPLDSRKAATSTRENAYYEKMSRNSDYHNTCRETHYENYYDNIGYRRRDPDTFEIKSNRTTTDTKRVATNRRVNYTPRPDSCKAIYEEVHASK